jgi:hypothetical protein
MNEPNLMHMCSEYKFHFRCVSFSFRRNSVVTNFVDEAQFRMSIAKQDSVRQMVQSLFASVFMNQTYGCDTNISFISRLRWP